MKIYTKTGDDGTTALWSGKRVAKNHQRLEAYGTLDELNSVLGLVLADLNSNIKDFAHQKKELLAIQELLFLMGSYISCDKKDLAQNLPVFAMDKVEKLEASIDMTDKELSTLKNFILPGGSKAASFCHLARCVCRRSERALANCEEDIINRDAIAIYLNRLSDYLFVLARYINKIHGIDDVIWTSR